MKSGFLKLNASDLLKGLLVAVLTALLTGLYQLVQANSELNWITMKPVVLAAVGAGLSYLIKNLFTNSEGTVLKTEKGAARNVGIARMLILVIVLSGMGLSASGQFLTPRGDVPEKEKSAWAGFFKPVDKNLLAVKSRMGALEAPSVWLFRPTVEISAMQLIPSAVEGKIFEVSSFQSVGMGVSYQHFIENSGSPYNNYGFNLLVLFDAIPRETTDLNLSLAGTVSALQYMNFGVGYNFGMKKPFLLTGLTYNFN